MSAAHCDGCQRRREAAWNFENNGHLCAECVARAPAFLAEVNAELDALWPLYERDGSQHHARVGSILRTVSILLTFLHQAPDKAWGKRMVAYLANDERRPPPDAREDTLAKGLQSGVASLFPDAPGIVLDSVKRIVREALAGDAGQAEALRAKVAEAGRQLMARERAATSAVACEGSAALLATITGVAAASPCAVATSAEVPLTMEETVEAIWAISGMSITAGRVGQTLYQAVTVGVEGYGSSYADAFLDLVHLMAEHRFFAGSADQLRALEDRLERLALPKKIAKPLADAMYPTHSPGVFGRVGQTVPVWDHARGEVAWIDRAATVFVVWRQHGIPPCAIHPGDRSEGAALAAVLHHGGEGVEARPAEIWQSSLPGSVAYVRDPVPPGNGPLFLATVRPAGLTPEEHNAWEAEHRRVWVRPPAP